VDAVTREKGAGQMNAYLTRRNADHHAEQRKAAIRAWHAACDRQDAEREYAESKEDAANIVAWLWIAFIVFLCVAGLFI